MCSVEGCPKAARSRGWCHTHYYRWVRHGDPEAVDGRTTRTPKMYRSRAIGGGKTEREHRLVTGCVPGDGMHVHHRDGNKLNNDLDNLIVLTPSQHSDLHPEGRYGTR